MKPKLFLLAALVLFAACSKSKSTVAIPTTSTFDITIDGNTYHETSADTLASNMPFSSTIDTMAPNSFCYFQFYCKDVAAVFSGNKSSTSITGNYTAGGHFNDFKHNNQTYNATSGNIDITQDDSLQIKGTFSFTVIDNNTHAQTTATGDFDILK